MLGFSENDLRKPLGELSGGPFVRTTLAIYLLSGEPVVILDEPTNHLDLASIRVMERALFHFPGAVIAASHDRLFIDNIANSMLIFNNERIESYSGDWSMYDETRLSEKI